MNELSTIEILVFLGSACVLVFLGKVERDFKFHDSPQSYTMWKTLWLAAWVCMFVAILLMLFEAENVRLGL